MTKKKIRYSEFPPVPAAEAGTPVAPAPATPAAAPVEPAVPAPAPAPAARRSGAPLDLARALAAARSAEEAAAAPPAAISVPTAQPAAPAPAPATPAPVVTPASAPAGGMITGRLTPMQGNAVIRRATPMRGNAVIPRADAAPVAVVEPATLSLRERARMRRGTVELLVFAVGTEWFGVELARVEEAIDLSGVRHIPEMPPAMLGVATVRGALTPVYAPEGALGLEAGVHSSALVFRRDRGRLGIAVDDVDDVHLLDLSTLRDAPGADATDGILLGVLRYRDGLLALLDVESLITACQAVPVMETA